MDIITLSPAYLKDYKSKAQVLAAWLAGNDFIIESVGAAWSGKPMNMEQADQDSYNIRYAGKRKQCTVKRKGDTWVI